VQPDCLTHTTVCKIQCEIERAYWTKGLQKAVRWFLDADTNLDSHQDLIITFWPIYNIP